MQGVFLLPSGIPDGRPGRDLAAGAGGGGRGDQRLGARRHERLAGGQQGQQLIETAGPGAHDQRLGGVDGAAATHGDHRLAIFRFAPEALVGLAQLGDIRVGLDILHHMHQALTQQHLQAVQQAEGAGFGKDHQGDLLVFGERRELAQAATAEAGIDRVVETGGHDGSFVLVVGRWAHSQRPSTTAQID
ncbi:hypothetical protein D3C84_686930 [compost metagenome]